MRGPNGEALPQAILFACTLNSVRSPMAAAMMRQLYGKFCFVDSVGVRAGATDPFIVEILDEAGVELGKHRPKSFDDLEDASFDLVVTLSPEAHHKAMEPTMVEGSREQRLDAYRAARDEMMRRIKARFAVDRAGDA
jgi:protein-tyrosine-phosphatase